MDYYINAKNFILKNARPLDMARWNYLFENTDKQDVIKILQTWVATRIIKEIDLEDKRHPIITDILEYLASGDEFDGHRWNGLNAVVTNNDYPHAPWWSYTQNHELRYNPTASLIGFILKYAEKESDFYRLACHLAKEAYAYFENNFPLEYMHEAACFVELYEDMSLQIVIYLSKIAPSI